jgi:hypothetical protein
MTNINKQSLDLFAIDGVQDLSSESAAAVSGGTLDMSALYNGQGSRLNNLKGSYRSLGWFNNIASWYQNKGNRDYIAYTGKNFTGTAYRLKAGTKGNLGGMANNNFESIKAV